MKKIRTSIKYATTPFWALTIALFLTVFVAVPQATAKEPIVRRANIAPAGLRATSGCLPAAQ